ncbi:MAG TPA: ATP-binding cassette domain-containing protein [Thermoanaerobaculia bacterium]|nr:ATP-binding cassette domain-containing protein [Thermoanaerobaculia bacterium]
MAWPVAIEGVSVAKASGLILDGVTLSVGSGESVALIGRSGAGKTSALKLVNGLVMPTSGSVRVDEQPLTPANLVERRRRIGYIVQGVGLFPHRSVLANIGTVPSLLGWPAPRIEAAARTLLDRLEIPFDHFAHRFPSQLSGGEQQRVGIARALIFEPEVLLCDEPFGALDPLIRRELQQLLLEIRRQRPMTMLFVTHDLPEALRMAGRVVLLDAGRVMADFAAADIEKVSHPLVRRFVESALALGATHA